MNIHFCTENLFITTPTLIGWCVNVHIFLIEVVKYPDLDRKVMITKCLPLWSGEGIGLLSQYIILLGIE